LTTIATNPGLTTSAVGRAGRTCPAGTAVATVTTSATIDVTRRPGRACTTRAALTALSAYTLGGGPAGATNTTITAVMALSITIAATASRTARSTIAQRPGGTASPARAANPARGGVVPTSTADTTVTDGSSDGHAICTSRTLRATDAAGSGGTTGTAQTSRAGIPTGTSATPVGIRLISGRAGPAVTRPARVPTCSTGAAGSVERD
jgi:hypothetical protein